jgi:hypothetical protein
MVKNKRKLSYIRQMSILTVILIVIGNISSFQSNIIVLDDINQESLNRPIEDPLHKHLSDVSDDAGGYSSINAANFNTIENASSLEFNRDYLANESSSFDITTPQTWNTTSIQFDLDPYSKEQIIYDPYFEQEYNGFGEYWGPEKIQSGQGVLTQFDLETNPHARTNIYNLKERFNPAYKSGDQAFWTREFDGLNLGNLDIQRGRIIQEEDEQLRNFNYFQTDPNFYKDLNSPYGGTYDPGWDDVVDLTYDESMTSLRVEIYPSYAFAGGNPSAAWWYFINIPYEADFAQMTLKWSIDDKSTFEADDQYEVIARINDKYIDGSNPISENGEVPFNGSSRALMVYNNTLIPGSINHDTISRTYDITELINGLVGINKFDFGIWAKNPSQGEEDKIIANFESIEIMFNTTTKYEVAALQYKYKLIDNDKSVFNIFKYSNAISFFLYLKDKDTDESELIRVLPFSMAQISSTDFGSTPWIDMEFSLSQKYQELLKADNLEFKIGVYFEDDFNERIDYDHYLDDVFFTINYNQTVTNPQLQIEIDDSLNWVNINNDIHTIDTSSWGSGDNHSFQFRTLDPSYQDKLYLNFLSDLDVNFKSNSSNGAKATYNIYGANSSTGGWNITYDNTFSYSKLLEANLTSHFKMSEYSIIYLNLPAFDYKGSISTNWEIFGATSPDFSNFSENLFKFNYSAYANNQSAQITGAFKSGNWTLNGYQSNYITNCQFNTTQRYLTLPAFYKNEIVQYNYTLLESARGNYSIALFNETGALMVDFPQVYSSNGVNIIGTIDLANKYKIGKYYLYIKWNDSANYFEDTFRFGSIIQSLYIINNTKAQFTTLVTEETSGNIAEFALNYTTYEDWGIENATILVFENSTGILRLWGRVWTGSYQIGNITYLGNGNYSIPLITEGTPNGTYPLFFVCLKALHQPQILNTSLKIKADKSLHLEIISGASLNNSKWVIDSDNIPYVNDTINSFIRVNITDTALGTPLTGGLGGLVIGRIGGSEKFFRAEEIGGGLYDLTLDTTNFNATLKVESNYIENKTLEIRCSANGYNINITNVAIFIDKIPTQLTVQNIDNVYAEGSISVIANLVNKIDPANPNPNNHGELAYYIHQGGSLKRNGSLDFLISGVYQGIASLSNLSAGEYTIFVNGTAFNCENSQSSSINFTIMPQDTTVLDISIPSTIRILKEFQIRTTLSYGINGTIIPNQIIFLNISIGQSEHFIVSTITNIEGVSSYGYIISSQYLHQNITIDAYYEGQVKIAASICSITKNISGKIPIIMEIFDFPSFVRVGYSARYSVRINITESGETLQNRIILFSAYYNDELTSAFVTDQLYTNEFGQCEYTISEIANENDNITVFFEYLGSTTVSYNLISKTDLIEPKWISNFTVEPLPSIIRYGQSVYFDMQFYCENSSISLFNLPISISFGYGASFESYTELIDVNNMLAYLFRVSDSFTGNLNTSIIFIGTNKIEGCSLNYNLNISPKIGVVIEFIEVPLSQYMRGTYTFKVSIANDLDEPLDGLLILFQLLDHEGNEIINYTALCEEGVAFGPLDLEIGDNYQIRVQFYAEDYYESFSITSEAIRVVNEFIIFLDILPYLLIAIGIVTGTIFVVYRSLILPRRRRRIESLKVLYQKLSDVENLQYLLILTKDGGIPCFSKSLADVPIDETLISGFLSAISSFGREIGKKINDSVGGLEELSYRQFKIILNEGDYVRVALLLIKRPSETIKQNLKKFNTVFEEVYEERLKNFKGAVFEDVPVTKMIEEVFEADLLYPHQIVETKVSEYLKTSTPNNVDKKIIVLARGEEFESNFYLRDLINHLRTKGIEDIKSFDSIQKLKSDKVVFAINPRTNYLIVEFQKYIKHMDADDKNVLYAIFDGQNDWMKISKYLNNRNIDVSKKIDESLEKLKKLHLIDDLNQISETGSAIATILKLIPDL